MAHPTLTDVKPRDWIEIRQEEKTKGVHGWTQDRAAGTEPADFRVRKRE